MQKSILLILMTMFLGDVFSQPQTHKDSLVILDKELAIFSSYIEASTNKEVVLKIDSLYQNLFDFPFQLEKQYNQLLTQVSHLIEYIDYVIILPFDNFQ